MSSGIPSFQAAAAALRKTTEALAREVARPSDSAPNWNDFEWVVATAVCAMQGVTVLLANRVRWSGPPLWRSFVNEQREQAVLRHEKIGGLLARLDEVLRNAECPAVALKGAALRTSGLYRAGERFMGDIDLLVRPDCVERAEAALKRMDYLPSMVMRRHIVFEPQDCPSAAAFGEHIDNPIRIELHTKIAEALPVREVGITDQLRLDFAEGGLKSYTGDVALLLHLILHASGNMRAHAARQIQLHDIAALARRMAGSDWSGLLREPETERPRWWLYPSLCLTERYYPGAIPADVLSQSRSACHYALRRWIELRALTDVSWSNLRIHAFPGLGWSRSPVEALRYIRSRVLPSREALSVLKSFDRKSGPMAHMPWYGQSHGRRILRWIFSRPPRVQTAISLRAAQDCAASRD